MKAPEKSKLRDRYATSGVEIPVARDGLSVYVHNTNPLTEISMEQLRDVFLGKITNWKDLGGPDNRIIVYSRENSSGTYVFFKDNVLAGRDFTPRAQTMPGTASVVNAVTKEKFGIGYGGAAYAKGLKILKLKKSADAPAIGPDHADGHAAAPIRWRGRCSFISATSRAATSRASSTGCCPTRARRSWGRSATTRSNDGAAVTSRRQIPVTNLPRSSHRDLVYFRPCLRPPRPTRRKLP